jgi:hypothetical protein
VLLANYDVDYNIRDDICGMHDKPEKRNVYKGLLPNPEKIGNIWIN